MEVALVDQTARGATQHSGKRLMSQNMQLSGHQGEVYCTKFSPCGDYLASAGFDKLINVWDVFSPTV